MNLALGFGGDFFTVEGDEVTFEAGDAEIEVPRAHPRHGLRGRLARSGDADAQRPGRAARLHRRQVRHDGRLFYAQQLVAAAPEAFNWAVLPPLAGLKERRRRPTRRRCRFRPRASTPRRRRRSSTSSWRPRTSPRSPQGDWLIPSSATARDAVLEATGGENGWDADPGQRRPARRAPFQFVGTTRSGRTRSPRRRCSSTSPTGSVWRSCRQQLTDGWNQIAADRPARQGHRRPRRCSGGDALGGPVEGNTPEAIQQRYGGFVTGIVAAVPGELARRPADRAVPQGRRPHHRRHLDDAAFVEVYDEVATHLDAYDIAELLVPKLMNGCGGSPSWRPRR